MLVALSKRLPLVECHRDQEVSELYVSGKVERLSAWNCLRALFAQIESVGIENAASRMTLPETVRVWPLEHGETCVYNDGGDPFIQASDGSLTPVFPFGFRVERNMFIVSNVMDRGSNGSAATNVAAAGAKFTMTSFPGESHDAWNAVRAAAKTRGGGKVWKAVVRMASIQNLPYGPYRSGAWGKEMQVAHKHANDEITEDSL